MMNAPEGRAGTACTGESRMWKGPHPVSRALAAGSAVVAVVKNTVAGVGAWLLTGSAAESDIALCQYRGECR